MYFYFIRLLNGREIYRDNLSELLEELNDEFKETFVSMDDFNSWAELEYPNYALYITKHDEIL